MARVNPRYVYTRPWLAMYQIAAIFNANRYAFIEASTKSGKTHACIVWALEQALQGKEGDNVWWVAPILGQAKIAFRRLKRAIPKAIYVKNESELTITLLNGVVIWFKSADNPDSLYGEDVIAAVIDEASRCKEQSWIAVRSTLTATQGPIRIIGNVKGRKNWAFKLGQMALSGTLPSASFHRITVLDAIREGVIPESELEDARAVLPPDAFRELYMAEPADDGSNPFGQVALDNATMDLSSEEAVAYGVDIAKTNDYTVVIGLDRFGRICEFHRWNMKQLPPGFPAGTEYWEATEAHIRKIIRNKPAVIDATAMGGDRVYEAIAKGKKHCHPFVFTNTSKQRLMESLASAIQTGIVSIIEGVVKEEHEQFEYVQKNRLVFYQAMEGCHDDCVCALALANEAQKLSPERTLIF